MLLMALTLRELETSTSSRSSLVPAVDETQDVAAIGALSMVAGAAADPAFEQLGDAGKEAFGPGAELRGQMAGEDGRQLVGLPQDDQAAIVGRSVSEIALGYRTPQRG